MNKHLYDASGFPKAVAFKNFNMVADLQGSGHHLQASWSHLEGRYTLTHTRGGELKFSMHTTVLSVLKKEWNRLKREVFEWR